VAYTQRPEPKEWEWREVEYERRRRRAKEVARRRGRLRLAALLVGIAVLISSAVLAARVVALPTPNARAPLAIAGGAPIPDGAARTGPWRSAHPASSDVNSDGSSRPAD
jgi:hypothetical protein